MSEAEVPDGDAWCGEEFCTRCGGEENLWGSEIGSDGWYDPNLLYPCPACNGSGLREDQRVFEGLLDSNEWKALEEFAHRKDQCSPKLFYAFMAVKSVIACKCAYSYGQRIVQPHCSLHGTVAAALSDSKEAGG